MDSELDPTIAYFSMEIAFEDSIPTYSGGLGVLAGDTIRAAADLEIPLCAVSLVYHHGYFRQLLSEEGVQREEPASWDVDRLLEEQPARVAMELEGREIILKCWRYLIRGVSGFVVPVYLLDANLPENDDTHRGLTDRLYGGDARYRLCQELILGIGGVRMLRALGLVGIEKYHLNEGHAAFLTLELLGEEAARGGRSRISPEDVEAVRRRCVFTTHTPVPAGHDRFPRELVKRVHRADRGFLDLPELFCPHRNGNGAGGSTPTGWREVCLEAAAGEPWINMTYLALNLSHFVNGVAKKHAVVSRLMFADYQIDSITNGVHAATWTAAPFQRLFDRHLPGWQEDNYSLRNALKIPGQEVWESHQEAKHHLVEHVNKTKAAGFDPHCFTIGFARRATQYKRADLLFHDPSRLRRLAERFGPLQVVYAGKAHPQDEDGKAMIRRVCGAGANLAGAVRMVYLEDYEMKLGRLLTAGVDVWLNTPCPPLEASGTSGMKAALNAVPSLSILDGWWIEGCVEGVTGWAIGELADRSGPADRDPEDAEALYRKLGEVRELFEERREEFIGIMRSAIALNGSYFNTHRMIQQYVTKAYFD